MEEDLRNPADRDEAFSEELKASAKARNFRRLVISRRIGTLKRPLRFADINISREEEKGIRRA